LAIELGLTPDGRSSATFDEYLDAAQAAGFATVGVGANRADDAAAAALAARGLHCHELLSLSIRRDEEATEAQARDLAAAAARVGAPWVLAIFNTKLRAESLALAVRCAAILNEAGARFAMEFGPGGAGVGSIPQAIEVVDAMGGPTKAGVMIDTWHFAHGPSTFDDLATIPLDHIAYVQFDDAPPWESDDFQVETMNRRAWPGDGVLELDRFADTLRARGWEGVVSSEVLNAEYAQLPIDEYCRQAFTTLARYWT